MNSMTVYDVCDQFFVTVCNGWLCTEIQKKKNNTQLAKFDDKQIQIKFVKIVGI